MSQQQHTNSSSMGFPSAVGANAANVSGGAGGGPPPPPHSHHYAPPHLQQQQQHQQPLAGLGSHPMQQQFQQTAPGMPPQQQRHPGHHPQYQQQQYPVFSASAPLNQQQQQQQRQMYAALGPPGSSAMSGGANMFPHSQSQQSMGMPPMSTANNVPIGGAVTGSGGIQQPNVPMSAGISMPMQASSSNVPIHSSQQLHPGAMAAAMEGHVPGVSKAPQQMLGPQQMQQSLGVPEQLAQSQNQLNFGSEHLPSSAPMASRLDNANLGSRGPTTLRTASDSRASSNYYASSVSGGVDFGRQHGAPSFNGSMDTMRSRMAPPAKSQGRGEDHGQQPQAETGTEDDYGLMGLLKVLKSGDSNRNMLSLGVDLTSLGLSLNTRNSLHPTFTLPWADRPVAREPEYSLPDCYKHPHPPLKTGHFKKFTLETLIYIFYSMPRDVLQAYAAQELYRRGWRFHQDLRLWLIYDPEMSTELSKKTAAASEAEKNVEYNYVYFDVQVWEKRPFAGNTVRDAPVNKGFIPPEEIQVPKAAETASLTSTTQETSSTSAT
eukprot:gb/GECG01015841.1/.p1 GENE.gb/GECG01015841.1/~~gb/GECG01015841.1/.p1  ORF type:complete len:546 (+),score=80.73 gb/GECG01015841.1/:1-1638(+)